MTPEGKVRKRLKEGVETLGGICEPFASPGRRGVPDVLVTLPYIGMRLVETKCPDGRLESWQKRDHERRARFGVHVRLAWSIKEVDNLLRMWRVVIAHRRQSRW